MKVTVLDMRRGMKMVESSPTIFVEPVRVIKEVIRTESPKPELHWLSANQRLENSKVSFYLGVLAPRET